jgi:hypothetical protein
VNGYPVPFRISTIRTDEYGMVEVVTSQYKTLVSSGCATRYETCLFWGTDGESHDVTLCYDRTIAAKNHFQTSQQNVVVKEIKKHYNQKRTGYGTY